MKTYVGIVRDHSASMRPLQKGAINDYNLLIDGIKNSVQGFNQEAYVTVVECGVGYLADVRVKEKNVNINNIKHLTTYETNGSGTPLFDSVGTIVKELENIGDNSSDSAYLLMVVTDGQNNVYKQFDGPSISRIIKTLQATDKWTFVFRVPEGYASELIRLGIPSGNIMEWEQTDKGIVESSVINQQATQSYFTARSLGQTSTSRYYTDLSNVKISEVKQVLEDVTDKVHISWIPFHYHGKMIREFCEETFGEYRIGSAYYQLTKPEKLQETKKICIKHLKSGKTYTGSYARTVLGLPSYGEVKIAPKDHGQYEIFIQSTSVNRKLIGDTRLLYYKTL